VSCEQTERFAELQFGTDTGGRGAVATVLAAHLKPFCANRETLGVDFHYLLPWGNIHGSKRTHEPRFTPYILLGNPPARTAGRNKDTNDTALARVERMVRVGLGYSE
jgi:hypothetical protein